MPFLISLAWRDLRASGGALWVFIACLALGVTLVAASGGMHKLLQEGLLSDTRALLGGDLEVDVNEPLPQEALDWIRQRGELSLVTELNTMLATEDDEFLRVELQSNQSNYPLYGQLQLDPAIPLTEVTSIQAGKWGVAIDRILAGQLDLKIGNEINIGGLSVQIRALVHNQPDRNLNANWRGLPVLIAQEAINEAGLIQPGSRVDYEYRVRTKLDPEVWKEDFYKTFPEQAWEVRTFTDRSDRIAERLGQIASGLLIIGFSTLFIGGLGVYNSINAYLSAKQKTIATLLSVGLRHSGVAKVYLLQTLILSSTAGGLGIVIGTMLALAGASEIAQELPIDITLGSLIQPLLIAWFFGLITAFTFALPAIGKTLAINPATLFRGQSNTIDQTQTPVKWWIASAVCALIIVLMILSIMPNVYFGIGFVTVVFILIALLELVVKVIQSLARRMDQAVFVKKHFAFALALSNLYQPGAPLRASLISLGSALTLLVACTLVVAGILKAVNDTIPAESPALVIYDVFPNQLAHVEGVITQDSALSWLDVAPLVRGRMISVNGIALQALDNLDKEEKREAIEDDYKLSYAASNIDKLKLVSGLWPSSEQDIHTIALEDREANELGITIGDIVAFLIEGGTLSAKVVGIYSQKGIQTRFWFEGVLSEKALDNYTSRYVGTAYMTDDQALLAQQRIASLAPNVITVRTATLLSTAKDLLSKAMGGLVLIAGISLLASLLVLSSVIAAGWSKQIYTATILHSLGTRLSVINKALHLEYLVLAFVTSIYAILLGSAIAIPLMTLRMKLAVDGIFGLGIAVALFTAVFALGASAGYFMRKLKIKPSILLKDIS